MNGNESRDRVLCRSLVFVQLHRFSKVVANKRDTDDVTIQLRIGMIVDGVLEMT